MTAPRDAVVGGGAAGRQLPAVGGARRTGWLVLKTLADEAAGSRVVVVAHEGNARTLGCNLRLL